MEQLRFRDEDQVCLESQEAPAGVLQALSEDRRHLGDEETRQVLLASARTLLPANPDFSLRTLLTESGISRDQFRRCFESKEELLAALTGEEVKSLRGILEAAKSASQASALDLRLVAGGDTPASPATDAWAERRLRVFERALAALEKRQEKFEQECSQRLSRIEEKLNLAAPAGGAASTDEPELFMAEPLADGQVSLEETSSPEECASMALEETGADALDRPASEKEMSEFLQSARRVARKASEVQSARPRSRPAFSRLLAWSVAGIMAVLVSIEFLSIGTAMGQGAINRARQAAVQGGVTHAVIRPVNVQPAPMTAADRIRTLAENGDARAQTLLALASLKPDADRNAAWRWAIAAARQGQPLGQYLLGTLYHQTDLVQAAQWFAAAAAQGNVKAMHNLAIAYAEGLGLEKDPVQAVNWFRRAAEQGYRDSQFDLAVMYERGMGVTQSPEAALTWYLIAARQGDAPSGERAQYLRQLVPAAEGAEAEKTAQAYMPQPASPAANEPPTL